MKSVGKAAKNRFSYSLTFILTIYTFCCLSSLISQNIHHGLFTFYLHTFQYRAACISLRCASS